MAKQAVSRLDIERAEVRRRAGIRLESTTPERAARLPEDAIDVAAGGMQRITDAPFDRMAIYKQITFRQHEAGERYRLRAYTAMAEPTPGSVDWNSSHSGFKPSTPSMFTAQAIASARQSYREALNAVGPRLGKVLAMVLIDEQTLADVGREVCGYKEHKSQVVAGATLFRLALDVLADHYRLIDDSVVRIARKRHAWMAEGAKPVDTGVRDVAKPLAPLKPQKGESAA